VTNLYDGKHGPISKKYRGGKMERTKMELVISLDRVELIEYDEEDFLDYIDYEDVDEEFIENIMKELTKK